MSPSDSSDRYRQVEDLYQRALDVPAERRQAFLAEACSAEPALRAEVETLLKHYEAAGSSFLDTSVADLELQVPRRVGRYEVLGQIGQGGMGVVFEARQENPRRTVAIKAIRPGLASAESLRRLEHEAAILGRLQHPAIAHVYEAGAADVETPGGVVARQPFFAMELIDGRELRDYVLLNRLGISERLELFARICDGVEYAHRKGVIHRDLKPSNILVRSNGEPKILDFGVARITDADVQMTTMHTRAEQVIGTLAYMSPEQVAGQADLDTLSDVYALGVILYELLAGRLPYELAGKPLAVAARVISEEPLLPLGTANRALRGDLATIVHKALEKEPERRYRSAGEMATDVRRFLAQEPITARPPSLVYQLSKFAQRRRGVVVSAAIVLLAIVGGAAATAWQAQRAFAAEAAAKADAARALNAEQAAKSEAERAMQAERVANAVNDFVNEDLLAAANPFNEPDRDIRLRDVLDRAAAGLSDRFKDDPLVEAAISETLGIAYRELGELEAAEAHLKRALELTSAELGEADRTTVSRLLALGQVYWAGRRHEEAEGLWQSALERAETAWGPEDPLAMTALNDLAALALSRNAVEEAEALAREALELRRAVLGDDDGSTLVSMNTLGSALERQGKFEEAEALFRECVERSRRVLGEEHPDTMSAVNNLGLFYTRLDRFEEAEPLVLENLALRQRVLGEEHPATLASMNNVGFFYGLLGRFEESETYYGRTYEIRLRTLGPEHPDTLLSMNNLGWLYGQMERWEEAEEMLSELVRITRQNSPDSLDLSLSVHSLGGLLLRSGQLEAAEPVLREALDGLRVHLPEGDWRIGASLSTYGNCLRRLDRYEEAEAAMLEGYERLNRILGPDHQQTQTCIRGLVNLYTDWEQPELAGEWQDKLPADPEGVRADDGASEE